jgi:hypothetical protein
MVIRGSLSTTRCIFTSGFGIDLYNDSFIPWIVFKVLSYFSGTWKVDNEMQSRKSGNMFAWLWSSEVQLFVTDSMSVVCHSECPCCWLTMLCSWRNRLLHWEALLHHSQTSCKLANVFRRPFDKRKCASQGQRHELIKCGSGLLWSFVSNL